MPPPPQRHYDMRSMSGRYASYWNAFLLHLCLCNVHVAQCLDRLDVGRMIDVKFIDQPIIGPNVPITAWK